jgi:hypothetical protein
VPDVTFVLMVISTLPVPVMAAFTIPEKSRAETDRAIKVVLKFIIVLRFPSPLIRS